MAISLRWPFLFSWDLPQSSGWMWRLPRRAGRGICLGRAGWEISPKGASPSPGGRGSRFIIAACPSLLQGGRESRRRERPEGLRPGPRARRLPADRRAALAQAQEDAPLGGGQVAAAADDFADDDPAADRRPDAGPDGRWPCAADEFEGHRLAARGSRCGAWRRGASRAFTTTSGRPSRSRSPTARPRPRIGRANQGPAAGGGVGEPPPDVAEQGRPHGERHAEPVAVEDVAVGLEQIEPAVGVEVGQREAEAEHRRGSRRSGRRRPRRRGRSRRRGPGRRSVERPRKLLTTRSERPSPSRSPSATPIPASALALRRRGRPRRPGRPLEAAGRPVLEQPAGGAVVGDEDVGAAVAVRSAIRTPSPRPSGRAIPAVRETSVNVPSPLLR